MRQLRGGLQVGLGEMPLGTGRVLADCLKQFGFLVRRLSILSRPRNQTWVQVSGKPSPVLKLSLPNWPSSILVYIPKQTIPIHGPRTKRPCFINRTTDESRVPNFPGWTHLKNSPSANECRKDYSRSHPPHRNQNKGMSLRILQTVGKAMSQSRRKWLQWYIRLSLEW